MEMSGSDLYVGARAALVLPRTELELFGQIRPELQSSALHRQAEAERDHPRGEVVPVQEAGLHGLIDLNPVSML